MPILSEFRRKFLTSAGDEQVTPSVEESFVSDVRNGMRPKQFIEDKFCVAMSRASSWQGDRSTSSIARFS